MLHKFYKYLLHNQIILALFLIIIGWFIFQTKDILVSIFIAYIIMAALLPAVDFFKKQGVPHIFSVLIPFLSVLVFLLLIIFPLIPFVGSQIKSLASDLPSFVRESANTLGFEIDSVQVQNAVARELNNIGRNAVALTGRVFGGIFSALTILIVSFYFLLYHDSFKKSLASLFHKDMQQHILNTQSKINYKLGAWLRGQLILSLVIGLVTWVALSLVGLPFAVPLALIAGLLEVVPTLGPIIAAIPAIIVALTINPTIAIIVIIIYIVIQILENNFLVPKIMEKAVGLNPVAVILSVMIGANLLGVAGALLSIPFISLVIILFKSINEEA